MEFTVNSTPFSDALALRATASVFDAHRGKLPGLGDLPRSPDSVAVAKQISELGQLITELGDEVLFRASAQDQEAHAARVITGFAAAVRPVGEAAAALGAVAHQLSFMHQTEHLRDQPDARDAREAAARVMDDGARCGGYGARRSRGFPSRRIGGGFASGRAAPGRPPPVYGRSSRSTSR